MNLAISQSNYIPWKGYFDCINSVDEFILYDDMQYTRRDWRNRNKIKTREGAQWLSIPVDVKGKYFQKISETTINDPSWAETHWRTIIHNYNKAPYFNDYKDIFEKLYMANTDTLLSRVNYNFLSAICSILGIKTKLLWSGDFELVEGKTERLLDLCKKRNATKYISAPAAKAYMEESLFEKEGIAVEYMDYSGYPEYRQMHGDFDHAVSVIDLIFNEGPDATKYMKSFHAGTTTE